MGKVKHRFSMTVNESFIKNNPKFILEQKAIGIKVISRPDNKQDEVVDKLLNFFKTR